MSRVLVDSNVLIDVVSRDPQFFEWSRETLLRARREAGAILNPLILAEVSTAFASPEELDRAFPAEQVAREPLPWEAVFVAGRAFQSYRKRGGTRRSPLPDFYIGAHAQVQGLRLLTRDVARYRTYFPDVELIHPPKTMLDQS
jgi:predicted nucleic acid-binding protein